MSDGTNTITLMATTTGTPPKRYTVEFFDGASEERDELPPLYHPFWSMVVRVIERTAAPAEGCMITVGTNSETN